MVLVPFKCRGEWRGQSWCPRAPLGWQGGGDAQGCPCKATAWLLNQSQTSVAGPCRTARRLCPWVCVSPSAVAPLGPGRVGAALEGEVAESRASCGCKGCCGHLWAAFRSRGGLGPWPGWEQRLSAVLVLGG